MGPQYTSFDEDGTRVIVRKPDMRPLVQLPNWDGKIGLGAIFIIGYYALVIILILAKKHLEPQEAQMVRDAMLALGPGIGIILGALFRSTAAEERQTAMQSRALETAIQSPLALPAPEKTIADATADGVERGISRSEPVATAPLAADGQRRDWLDPPATDETLPDYAR